MPANCRPGRLRPPDGDRSGFPEQRRNHPPGLDYPALARSFLRAELAGRPVRVVGATVHRHVERLLFLWPAAQFIHLVRDPRDVARSRIQMGWDGNVWTAADAWIAAEAECERLRARVPADRWLALRSRTWPPSPRPNCGGSATFCSCPTTSGCSISPTIRAILAPTRSWPGSGGQGRAPRNPARRGQNGRLVGLPAVTSSAASPGWSSPPRTARSAAGVKGGRDRVPPPPLRLDLVLAPGFRHLHAAWGAGRCERWSQLRINAIDDRFLK